MPVTFLVDVDNTLLDNDRFRADVEAHFTATFGSDATARYWAIQERRFVDLGYRDYLGAVQEWWEGEEREPRLLAAAGFLLDYPFENLLYDGALGVLAHLGERGQTVVLTDGDAIFQPRKIERSGIGPVVDGRVLVYVHKELELDDVARRFPAERYVLVDDKPCILAAVKLHWGERVTTVLPRQGQFGRVEDATADVTVDRIAELVGVSFDQM